MNPETETLDYMADYEAFQKEFKLTETSPDKVGELIMKMAGHYARYNIRFSMKLRNFSLVKAKLINSADDNGKAMTASKAEMLADATDEAKDFELARIHLQNIQEYINSLKSLQKPLMIEYGHVQ